VVNEIAQRSIAVVKMRLPYTDRRSLSQAWFSSLHLAEDRSSLSCGGQERKAPAVQACAAVARRGGPMAPVGGGASKARGSDAAVRHASMGGSEVTQRRYRTQSRIPLPASFAGAQLPAVCDLADRRTRRRARTIGPAATSRHFARRCIVRARQGRFSAARARLRASAPPGARRSFARCSTWL